ncbi:MAG TPA: hypothetical protein VK085_05095 [Pseudogracilibacillus sp.]|nr:hypothetical protein [Pseudogracilibacillus sp.]
MDSKFEIKFYSGDALLGTQTVRSDDYDRVYDIAQKQLYAPGETINFAESKKRRVMINKEKITHIVVIDPTE